MQVAALPDDETERLRVLHSLHILDTPAEEAFDRVTRVLARLLSVPIALVSLVDEHRQWFKSRLGLEACETSRDISFCSHALLEEDMLVVQDARTDPRFRDNPAVIGATSVRFYAGVPLRSSDGHAIGTLCAVDTVPRTLSPEDGAAMRDLAAIVERELLSRESTYSARVLHQADTQALRLSETRFRTIFEQTPTGAAIVAPDGRFVEVNARLCEMLGYRAEELVALTFQQITFVEDLESDLQQLRQLLAGHIPTYAMEKRYLRSDGSHLWVQLHVALVRQANGDPLHFIAIVEDIQARKENERLQREHRVSLEEQVSERTAELRATNMQLRGEVARRETMEATLRAQNQLLQAVIDNAQDAYVAIDSEGRITEWNDAAEHMFGWGRHEVLGLPMGEIIIPPAWRTAHDAGMRRFLRTRVATILSKATEVNALRRSGEVFPAELRISTAATADGETLFAFITDVSERKRVEADIIESREAIQKVTDSLPVLISYVDRELRYQFNNDGYRRLLGRDTASMRGTPLVSAMPPAMVRTLMPSFQRALAGERVQHDDVEDHEADPRTWSVSLVPDMRGREVIGFYMLAQDVTSRRQAERQLRAQAMRDPLTGLPNRRALLLHLAQNVAFDTPTRQALALFFLDLDEFKPVNDAYGHEAGDELLRLVGARLKATVRHSDFTSRLAGDEFVIVSHGVADEATASRIADAICSALKRPFSLAGVEVGIAASVGVVVCDAQARITPDALLAAADSAMYEAKRKGRNRYRLAARIVG
ncbi:PAS domain S-box protein [Caballeronia sp. LZ062]|uniref:PAS domain S-box protein n=1 Tax=unclassified Caballeronia TaxID=2646786 RepID=UPI0028592700|nr:MULTISPECIES: PAS domain S-box protein [unclassified Caballeronia]MDR5857673.1 PAS domain S-box protein [Caballeronia sp. LZ050]MDR5869223.1 PAS domain S-box protein [Caballeronia sp. LZ062]